MNAHNVGQKESGNMKLIKDINENEKIKKKTDQEQQKDCAQTFKN